MTNKKQSPSAYLQYGYWNIFDFMWFFIFTTIIAYVVDYVLSFFLAKEDVGRIIAIIYLSFFCILAFADIPSRIFKFISNKHESKKQTPPEE